MTEDQMRLLRPMEAVVQLLVTGGGGGQWWDSIAAFDSILIAEKYCEDCIAYGAGSEYRVVKL